MTDRSGTFWLVHEAGPVSHEVPLPIVKAASCVPTLHRPPPPMRASAASPSIGTAVSGDETQRKGGGISRMIRTSVATARVKAVSPPLSFAPSPRSTSPSTFASDAGLELLSSSDPANRRVLIERQFPCCTFGRHTSLKGTPYRIRHFAVSRFHFSIAFVPNELLPVFVVAPSTGCSEEPHTERPPLATALSDGSRGDGAVQRPTKGKRSKKAPAARVQREDAHTAAIGVIDPAAPTASDISASFLVFNWSLNPLFVNDRSVPPHGAGALVLHEGDVVSLLVSAFDPLHGVFQRERDANGDPVVMVRESEVANGSSSQSMPLNVDNGAAAGDGIVGDYDPFASPLRKGTSIRHPEPLPVFILRRREASPETVTTRHSARASLSAPPLSPQGGQKRKKRRT